MTSTATRAFYDSLSNGELLYQLKYRQDKEAIDQLAEAAANLRETWRLKVDGIIAVPPTQARRLQPVQAVAGLWPRCCRFFLCAEGLKKVKKTPQLKDLTDYHERTEAKQGGAKSVHLLTLTKKASRMKIFIGGSRAVSKLNGVIRDRLNEFIRRGDAILIGDANGADRAAQQHFAERQYPNVEVFCMEQCRNNIGSWPIRNITPPNNRKDFSYYAAKDIVMSREAGCGVMLWDGKSKGTLQNILNLMAAGKKTLVYFAPSKDFHVLTNERDLPTLLARCDRGSIEAASRALGVTLSQPSLPLVHS